MPLTEKQKQDVLQALSNGSSLRAACVEADISDDIQVRRLAKEDPEFASHYAHARMEGYQSRADRLIDDAWNMSIPADHKRIIIDTQKWELSKMLPKLYGDRLDLQVTRTQADELSTEELQAIVSKGETPRG